MLQILPSVHFDNLTRNMSSGISAEKSDDRSDISRRSESLDGAFLEHEVPNQLGSLVLGGRFDEAGGNEIDVDVELS